MHFAAGDMRDHTITDKNDHRPSYRRCRAAQQQRCIRINFREIFGDVRFSTFSTISEIVKPRLGDWLRRRRAGIGTSNPFSVTETMQQSPTR
jgi:hypothetical protein